MNNLPTGSVKHLGISRDVLLNSQIMRPIRYGIPGFQEVGILGILYSVPGS